MMNKQSIKFGNVKGDVIGAGATGIIAKKISGNINIGASQMEKMPDEYSQSLKEFSDRINQLLEKYHVEPSKVQPVQETVNDLAEEAAEAGKKEKVDYVTEMSLKSKLVSAAAGLAKLLPKGAELAAAFTPLAPFGKLIGEAVDVVVKKVIDNE
ncbi:MAG TPA: hypothetical protein VFD91_01600 [Mariniphaga sp.]|nr:hypothetical protein [Mariniphaga sp.]